MLPIGKKLGINFRMLFQANKAITSNWMLKENIRLYGIYAVCVSTFFLQLSTAGITLGSIIFILCWLCSDAVRDLPEVLKKYPLAIISTLLFFMFVVGVIYSPASAEVILDTLKEYRILLYIPIVMCLCKNSEEAPKYFLNSFLIGSIFALISSYLLLFNILPRSLSYAPVYNSIISPTPHSGFMALLIFLLLGKLLRKDKHAVFGLPIIILALHNLLFLTGSSTGIVIFGALLFLLAIQFLSAKRIAAMCIVSSTMAMLLFYSSSKVAFEVNEAVDTIKNYEIGSGTMRNNVSLRLDWWLSSYWLMKQKPLFGHGTGAFEMVHDEIIKGTNIEPRPHPHNEYLYTGVQLGFAGLTLFILLIAAPFYGSFRLNEPDKHSLQGILIYFALGNLFEGWLIGSAAGNFYVMAVAVYVSSKYSDGSNIS